MCDAFVFLLHFQHKPLGKKKFPVSLALCLHPWQTQDEHSSVFIRLHFPQIGLENGHLRLVVSSNIETFCRVCGHVVFCSVFLANGAYVLFNDLDTIARSSMISLAW
jgi:hypothetical protein